MDNFMCSDYEYRIKGRLSRELLATFAPLRTDADIVETVLVGPIIDRAQLHGVIARFETLGLELLAFRRLPTRVETTPQPGERSDDLTTR
jgi:hypothetical protein